MGALNKIWYFMLFILILTLSIYENVYYKHKGQEGFSLGNYLMDPIKYGGPKGQLFGRVVNISQDHFYFDVGDRNLKIFGSIEKAEYGETVVFLNYRKDGIIELIDYHNYSYNYFLYAISVFALLIFIFIFFNEWKLTAGGFENA